MTYYEKAKRHFLNVMKSLLCDDVDIYLFRKADPVDPWALILFKPLNTLLTVSYSTITGMSISTVLKPDKVHGTGYKCLKDGYTSISIQDLKDACILGNNLLAHDLFKHIDPQNGVLTKNTLKQHQYQDAHDYFEHGPFSKSNFELLNR